MSELLPCLPEPLRVQVVRELVRLRSPKVDSAKKANELLQPSISLPPDGQAARPTRYHLRRHPVCPPIGSQQKACA